MSGVEERLSYLEDTKELLRQTINENGGDLLEESPFSNYPEQLQHIVDTSIVPQSTLDSFTEEAIDINGFTYLDNLTLYKGQWNNLCFKFPGKLDIGDIIYDKDGVTKTVSMMLFRIYGNNGQVIATLPYSAVFPIDVTSIFTQYHLDYDTSPLKVEMDLSCSSSQLVTTSLSSYKYGKFYKTTGNVAGISPMILFDSIIDLPTMKFEIINDRYYFTEDMLNTVKDAFKNFTSIGAN